MERTGEEGGRQTLDFSLRGKDMMLITGPSFTSPFLLAFSSPARNSRLPFPRGVENPDLVMDANHQDENSVSEAGKIEGKLKGHRAYHVWEGNEPCSNVYRTAIFRRSHAYVRGEFSSYTMQLPTANTEHALDFRILKTIFLTFLCP